MSHYFLDRSSLIAPLVLPIAPGMRVLDMCAAPGGKLLVMLSRLIDGVFFVANDVSSARAERLRRVINAFVPPKVAHTIKITNKDASFFALRDPGYFDAVLLDAPCSSEQHVFKNPHLLKEFKGLKKSLPQRQYSLLCSALLAVKSHGHIMYATCSINQNENQGVIHKLLKKKGDTCRVISLSSPLGENSVCGTTILPHLHHAGPAFCSLIKKEQHIEGRADNIQ